MLKDINKPAQRRTGKREKNTNLGYHVKFMGAKKCFDWRDSDRDLPPGTQTIN